MNLKTAGDYPVKSSGKYINSGDFNIKSSDYPVKSSGNCINSGGNLINSGDFDIKSSDYSVKSSGDPVKSSNNPINPITRNVSIYEKLPKNKIRCLHFSI